LQYGHLEKKALIIISDGGDNASHIKYSQVHAKARQSQSLIYSIALVGSDGEEENPGLLQRLCKDTGGIAYFRARANLSQTYRQKSHAIFASSTRLVIAPQNMKRADAFRKIEVKVTAPGHGRLRVRTRQGYSPAAEKQPTAQSGRGRDESTLSANDYSLVNANVHPPWWLTTFFSPLAFSPWGTPASSSRIRTPTRPSKRRNSSKRASSLNPHFGGRRVIGEIQVPRLGLKAIVVQGDSPLT